MTKEISEIIEDYKKFYPQYTLDSLASAIYAVSERLGEVNALTIDYFMRSSNTGGFGYGVLKYYSEKVIRWISDG